MLSKWNDNVSNSDDRVTRNWSAVVVRWEQSDLGFSDFFFQILNSVPATTFKQQNRRWCWLVHWFWLYHVLQYINPTQRTTHTKDIKHDIVVFHFLYTYLSYHRIQLPKQMFWSWYLSSYFDDNRRCNLWLCTDNSRGVYMWRRIHLPWLFQLCMPVRCTLV